MTRSIWDFQTYQTQWWSFPYIQAEHILQWELSVGTLRLQCWHNVMSKLSSPVTTPLFLFSLYKQNSAELIKIINTISSSRVISRYGTTSNWKTRNNTSPDIKDQQKKKLVLLQQARHLAYNTSNKNGKDKITKIESWIPCAAKRIRRGMRKSGRMVSMLILNAPPIHGMRNLSWIVVNIWVKLSGGIGCRVMNLKSKLYKFPRSLFLSIMPRIVIGF